MKKFLKVVLLLSILWFVYENQEKITSVILEHFIYKTPILQENPNAYKLSYNYRYVTDTTSFTPTKKEEFTNIFYSILNNGWSDFTFYCEKNYPNCLEDIAIFFKDEKKLSYINNYVHPYNTYKSIHMAYNSYGRITLSIEKLYTEEDIAYINKEIEKIYEQIITPSMSEREKIKAIHDYIIDTTTYDKEGANSQKLNETNPYESNKASGVLKYHLGLCSGYTDLMAIFLNKMNIPNYRISSDTHIWNFVYLNNKWYHLDLTWDDPTVDGKDIRLEDFFLITSEQLKTKDQENQHDYPKEIYIET